MQAATRGRHITLLSKKKMKQKLKKIIKRSLKKKKRKLFSQTTEMILRILNGLRIRYSKTNMTMIKIMARWTISQEKK